MVCLGVCFYLSCLRSFLLLKSVGWFVSLVLFENCLHAVLATLFLEIQFGSDQVQAFSLCSPCLGFFPALFCLLPALRHILNNFTAPTFQLAHPLFRSSHLLVSLSVELLLQGLYFHFYKFCLFFFLFRPSRSF